MTAKQNPATPKFSLINRRGSIANKILLQILLFSSFVTLVVTAYQLFSDYREQVDMVDQRMTQIELSYGESLGNAIWFLDTQQIESILAGIMKFEDVHYVGIQIREGDTLHLGQQRAGGNPRIHDVDVWHTNDGRVVNVGRLNIESNLNGVLSRLGKKGWLILISQALKTFVVSFFILFIIYQLVARHLSVIADFAATLNIEEKDQFLRLNRKESVQPDELDQISQSMNRMKQDLIDDATELRKLKEKLELERDYLREEVITRGNFGEIIGDSEALKHALAQVESVADTTATVLILGASGVGKEMIARAIHAQSDRADKPMVKVNCASVPNELFESEFFGHVQGSFTGAHKDRIGRLQLADGGTLFLDEVGEIPTSQQGKLLRALQENEFERIGDNKTIRVDLRVVAATNRDLQKEIQAGRFREDLFYRLSVFPIEVPTLRERVDDVVPLALNFLEKACKELGRKPFHLSRSQAAALQHYHWPGNIRELKNTIERAVISSTGDKLVLDIVGVGNLGNEPIVGDQSNIESGGYLTNDEFRELEKANIVAALKEANWKTWGDEGAAALLGVKPTTLAYQIKTFGIEKPS